MSISSFAGRGETAEGLSLSQVSSFYTFQHYPGYLTLSSTTPPFSALRVFTSDLFCLHGTLCSFGLGKQDDCAIRSSQNVSSAYPCYCFPALQPWESYVLILLSFQEKYIPQCCFHVCHIMEEKVSPCILGRQPALSTKQPGHVHRRIGGENNMHTVCLLRI